MDEFNMLPIYRKGMGEISNGVDIIVPSFCKRNCEKSEKCKQHYAELENAKPGLYQCPYGFASYVFPIEEDTHIFTCLRVEGEYNPKVLLPKIKNEGKHYREISTVMLEQYAEAYRQYWLNQYKYDKYKQFVDDIFHDVRKFNQQIKIKNDRLYQKSQSGKKFGEILELSKSIHVISWFLTLRLNNHDFLYNEKMMTADIPSDYNIYKIIHKVKLCIQERADAKNIKVSMSAHRQFRDMKAYDCIQLLPFLILDNAIKYSPNGETIDIIFIEKENQQHVTIRSLGPVVSESELAKICNQGYRGEAAEKLTEDGMGIGLYTAKCICAINGITMQVNSAKEIKKRVRNIDYSEFTVDFWINL